MRLRTEKIAAIAAVLIMLTASLWGHFVLPDAPLPVHFGLDGIANGFQARDIALLIHPGLTLTLATVMLWILPAVLPKSGAFASSQTAYGMVTIATVLFLAASHLVMVMAATGQPVDHGRLAFGGVGLLFLIIGNYLPKMRRNRLIGIRTPWTLADERVWDKTHRMGGRLLLVTGLVIIAGAVLAPPDWRAAIMTVAVLGPMIISCAYSYLAARALNLV